MRFSTSALGYLNNLADPGRVEMESVNSFTDRYAPVQSISGNLITMRQPAWNNNNFGYDTFASPHRAGPLYLTNAYEFLDSPGEWYLDPASGTLSYIPLSGQNMSSAGVELPTLQSLVNIGGTYDAPVHHVTFSGITFTGTSWRGPSSNEGYVDQQTGAYIAGNWNWPGFGSCHNGCAQFEAARPHWLQMPAAVQISAANTITLSDSQFVNLGQTVYRMPYSGMSIGYGWGANDAGGSDHYANRGLYNYQPRYSTPTRP